MKNSVIAKMILTICAAAFMFTPANAKTSISKYPIKLVWDTKLSAAARASYINSENLNKDIKAIYENWLDHYCARNEDFDKCMAAKHPPLSQVFDDILVATPDLNNDGKRDLIMLLGAGTGMAGMGRCGLIEMWFYEFKNGDYYSIGKTSTMNSMEQYIGAPKAKGQFRDFYEKAVDEFCNAEKPKFYKTPFNIEKHYYFDDGSNY